MRSELQRRFDENPKTPEQMEDRAAVRTGCYTLALLVERTTPPGRERAAAIAKIEEALSWSLLAIERPSAAGGRELTMDKPRGS